MEASRRFKIKLAVIGFAPSLLFACAVVLLIRILSDFSSVSLRSFLLFAGLVLLILNPLSIWFDRKWQKPLVDRITAAERKGTLSAGEARELYRLGLGFPIRTYVFNLFWWLMGGGLGCIWFSRAGVSGPDPLCILMSTATCGILSALTQFYAVKFFLWKTLRRIIPPEALRGLEEIRPPLAIRTKLLLSFLSVIIPSLLYGNLLAYSLIFKQVRSKDIEQKQVLVRAVVDGWARDPAAGQGPEAYHRLIERARGIGLELPFFVYDLEGRRLFPTAADSGYPAYPLPPEKLRRVLERGVDQSFNIEKKATVLSTFLSPEGPVLLAVCPWKYNSVALEGVRRALSIPSIVLFVLLILVTLLASQDLSGPLKSLTGIATDVASGHLDREVTVLTDDEVGKLASALGEMKRRLVDWNRSLETKVRERTRELVEANKALTREIEERGRIQEALRDSQQMLSFHVQQTPLAFIEWNTRMEVMDWNPAAERIFGYSKQEAMGRHAAELIAPDWNRVAAYFYVWCGFWGREGGLRATIRNVAKDGSQLVCRWYNTPLLNKAGRITGLASLVEDVTDRTQWEAELERAKEVAEASARAKSEFLANMSHEIRTPMNGVIGMTGLLLDTDLSPEQREYAETIRCSAESLLSIINDVLDFSKIEAGQLDLEILDFDLRTTVEDVTEMLAIQAEQKGLEFSSLVYSDVPSLVRGDPGRLRQILLNLVANAIKFTDRGEVFIRVTLEEETEKTAMVRFEIRDTGIGIPQDRLDRLFRSFSQVDASITRRYGGTGLGLAISKRLAEMMGGRIGVESEQGKGSTFWFTVALEKQLEVPEPEIAVPENIQHSRILVVDDHPTNRFVLREMLRSWGCRFEEAENGEQALEILRQGLEQGDPFRIALVDMQMPGMDGKTLGERIKADPALRETILVMVTSMGLRGDAKRMQEAGFSAYLTKPIKGSSLYDCLATVAGLSWSRARERPKRIVTRYSLAEDKKRRLRILVAEDNAVNQKVAVRILEKLGYRADAVGNGREAVAALERIPYDLVLMDVQMPEMDGFEATRKIRDPDSRVLRHDVLIIAMTAHAMKGDRERCLEAGMDDYVSKPVTAFALSEVLDKHVMGEKEGKSRGEKRKSIRPEPVDIRRIQDVVGEDLGFEKELIESFLASSQGLIEALESAARQQDREEMKRLAHSLKGASATAGATGLEECARRIEQMVGRYGSEDMVHAVGTLKAELARVRAYLREYLMARQSSPSAPLGMGSN